MRNQRNGLPNCWWWLSSEAGLKQQLRKKGAVSIVITGCVLCYCVNQCGSGQFYPHTEGLLVRDPRMVERKKPGQLKARKKFAWCVFEARKGDKRPSYTLSSFYAGSRDRAQRNSFAFVLQVCCCEVCVCVSVTELSYLAQQ